MSATSEKYFEEALKQIGTNGEYQAISPEDLASLVMFLVYGQNVYSQFTAEWTGCSFSQQERSCLLVARRRVDGIHQVAFTTARNPTDCVSLYIKKLREDRLEWFSDKYR